MPELPEVETVVRDLRPRLVGRRFLRVRRGELALRRPWPAPWASELQGRRALNVQRRGKWIQILLDPPLWLLVHLGMTGQLTVASAAAPVQDHTHLQIDLGGPPDQLRFRDIRRFGSVTLFTAAAELTDFFTASGLGPEPFDLDADYWRNRLRSSGRNLKAILLDQTVVAGVGNIYADEALFEAKLPPTRLGRDVTAAAAGRLRAAVVAVLERAIGQRGSTIRNYVGGSGLAGGYQKEFCVYGRTGQPCVRCGTPVARVRLAGRSTHFCPRCQAG